MLEFFLHDHLAHVDQVLQGGATVGPQHDLDSIRVGARQVYTFERIYLFSALLHVAKACLHRADPRVVTLQVGHQIVLSSNTVTHFKVV